MKSDDIVSANAAASSSLIIARIFYGVNWFNVAAIFPLLMLDFEQDIALLGSISAAFFIGVGIFQIPAGIFAARYTPRTSAILGIAISSLAALVYGFTTDASQLVWLRFIVGAGMAFFFSSSIILIARFAGAKSSGFSIGLMNSAHSVGGIIGIFAWIIIAQMVGWRPSLVISGAIGLATAALMIVAIPRQTQPTDAGRANLRSADVRKILINGPLVALGLVLTGIQAAWALMLTFIVVYLQGLRISLEVTGIIASLALISAIVSAPLIGGFYDKIRDAKKILFICGAGISISLAAMFSEVLPVIIASVIAVGFFSGGAFTVSYAKARKMKAVQLEQNAEDVSEAKNRTPDYGALNVAWINGLSLLGVLWMPLAFSFAVKSWGGYPMAWLLSGILTALFVIAPLPKIGRE
jgi:MFS family permease